MGSFADHITQAKHNLNILKQTNKASNAAWDWQVTMCFYVAVHLVNGHIAKSQNLQYRSHKQVKHALNPEKHIALGTEIPMPLFLAYGKLQNLSRRSRYLCLDTDSPPQDTQCYLTFDKHLKRAIGHLDAIMKFISVEYAINFDKINIDCIEIKKSTLDFFKYEKH